MSFIISSDAAPLIAGGLIGVMNVESGPTNEQQAVYKAFARHLLKVDIAATDFAYTLTPEKLVTALEDQGAQRLFTQMAIMLEMCRHPRSEVQLAQLEAYAAALNFHGPQLDAVRGLVHHTAEQATADFLRGAATATDFADMDHLANAHRPLAEIREAFHVIPLRQPMCPDEDPALWPGN